VKVGIVGLGNVFSKHLQSIELIPDMEFTAGCDIDPEKNAIDAEFYTDILDMLTSEELDIVSVCTPNYLHPEHIKIVMENSSAYCICEKPLCVPQYQLDMIEKMYRDYSDRVFPVSQNRFNLLIGYLKENVDKMGDIYSVYITQIWNRNEAYFKSAPWRGTKEMDGGGILNQGYHFVDILYYLFGPFNIDYVNMETKARDIEIEDSAIFQFSTETIDGTFVYSMLATGGNMGTKLAIISENLTCVIGGYALDRLEYWSSDVIEKPVDEECPSNQYDGYKGSLFKHPEFYRNIYNHITTDEKLVCSLEEAIEVHRIIKNIYDY
jgi:predicted dehydrogenase